MKTSFIVEDVAAVLFSMGFLDNFKYELMQKSSIDVEPPSLDEENDSDCLVLDSSPDKMVKAR